MPQITSERVSERRVEITLTDTEIADAIALFARTKMKRGWKRPPVSSMQVELFDSGKPVYASAAKVSFVQVIGGASPAPEPVDQGPAEVAEHEAES